MQTKIISTLAQSSTLRQNKYGLNYTSIMVKFDLLRYRYLK